MALHGVHWRRLFGLFIAWRTPFVLAAIFAAAVFFIGVSGSTSLYARLFLCGLVALLA